MGANQFFIVGPKADPAGISKVKSAVDAYVMIAKAKAKFFSRGDNSGTNKRELAIWCLAGIQPAGSWYVVTHAFMGPTLLRADREKGYFMTDNSTYYVKKSKLKHVVPLFKGDPLLINVYHALICPIRKNTWQGRRSWPVPLSVSLLPGRGRRLSARTGWRNMGVPCIRTRRLKNWSVKIGFD